MEIAEMHEVSLNNSNSTPSEDDSVLRRRPDISSCYRTPGFNSYKFTRRRLSIESTRDYLGNVPVSVVYQMCSYLNKKDLVNLMMSCKRFREIGADSKFWAFLNLFGKHITDSSLHVLIERKLKVLRLNTSTVSLSDLSMVGSSWCSPAPSLSPAVSLACLTHLDMSQTKFSQSFILNDLLERCNNLVALSLELCDVMDDRTCAEIAKNFDLMYLNLAMARNISIDGAMTILHCCSRLSELNLAWTDLTGETIDCVCGALPVTLRKLNLSGTREAPEMSDQNIRKICESCNELCELDVSDNVVLTEKSLEYLVKLPKLKALTISRCYGIDPMKFLLMKNLDILNCYGCVTGEGYDVLRQRLRLTGINVSPFSSVAKPTVGESVSSIWGQRTRDLY